MICILAYNLRFATRLSKKASARMKFRTNKVKEDTFVWRIFELDLMLVHLCKNNQQRRKLFNHDVTICTIDFSGRKSTQRYCF